MKHVLNSTTCVMLHRSQYRVESCVSTVKAVTTFRSLTEVSPISSLQTQPQPLPPSTVPQIVPIWNIGGTEGAIQARLIDT